MPIRVYARITGLSAHAPEYVAVYVAVPGELLHHPKPGSLATCTG